MCLFGCLSFLFTPGQFSVERRLFLKILVAKVQDGWFLSYCNSIQSKTSLVCLLMQLNQKEIQDKVTTRVKKEKKKEIRTDKKLKNLKDLFPLYLSNIILLFSLKKWIFSYKKRNQEIQRVFPRSFQNQWNLILFLSVIKQQQQSTTKGSIEEWMLNNEEDQEICLRTKGLHSWRIFVF